MTDTPKPLPECWQIAEAVLPQVRTLYLFGPPGTGKTRAAIMGTKRPDVIVTTLTDDTPAAELRGYDIPVNGTFSWRNGPWVRAWKEGSVLVINELPRASMDTLSFALAILDNADVAQLDLPTGESVRPALGFRCIATGNDPPEALPDALRDRFPVSILIDAVHPGALARLPLELRDAAEASAVDTDPGRRLGIRTWYEFALLRAAIDPGMAARACFGPRAEEILDALKLAVAAGEIGKAAV